ncbi:NUDIX domain-containing protein [Candidatus Woesearchaeota archaeon]|jgi:ADP-ribose pyrophosphatase YjhB (NUDIX family)|nr:NUDIX domain-containing protein [Candidatus Woesearchaeota archaeon]MBT7062462.1 NUDIX domain-containing protein [Candidatus Woesearchaeota archaeon]MBT7402895.1 NUDIX domain-containing protein [Candidatus Woesearchaeota archaeon]
MIKEAPESVHVFIKNSIHRKFLFILRDDISTIVYPNTWTITGGYVDINEKPIDAIKRETLEEIGLELDRFRFLSKTLILKDEHNAPIHKDVYWYYGETVAKIDEIILTEGQLAEYITLDQAIERDTVRPIKEYVIQNRSILEN